MSYVENRATSIRDFTRDLAGAVAGSELRSRFGASALKRAVARGDLARVFPDVYAPVLHAQSFIVRAQAAALWADAPVGGTAALFLWGLIESPPTQIEVYVPHGRRTRGVSGLIIRQGTVELPQTTRHGIPVLTPAAALVLAYGNLPKARRSDVLYAAIRRRLTGPAQLESILVAAPRIKARRSLERSVRAATAGAQSYLEERALYRVFNTAEFARFVRQHEVVIEGNQFFFDMFDPATKTALELDGRKGHLDEFRQKNIERDCWVATIGVLTLRFSYQDLIERPEWCRQVVRQVLAVRGTQMRARVRT